MITPDFGFRKVRLLRELGQVGLIVLRYSPKSLNPWVEGSNPSGGSFPKALQAATLRHNGFTRRDLRQQSGRPRWCLLVPAGATLDGTNLGTGTYDVTVPGTIALVFSHVSGPVRR